MAYTHDDPSKLQIGLINRIALATSLKPPPDVEASRVASREWIGLALFSCLDNELAKIGQKRTKKAALELTEALETLARIAAVKAPSDISEKGVRRWLEGMTPAIKAPPAQKLLEYWSRALLYRNLNDLAEKPRINVDQALDALPASLPPLKDDYQAPSARVADKPMALLIAHAEFGSRKSKFVLLGIPLSYDRDSGCLIPPPQGALPFFNREWLEPPDPDAPKRSYLSSVADCEDFFGRYPAPTAAKWPEYWRYVESFVRAVTDSSAPIQDLAHIIGGRELRWEIVSWDSGGAAKTIAKTYDEAIGNPPGLLNTICNKARASCPAMDLNAALQLSGDLLGHIDTFAAKSNAREGFALERSQRVAATAMTQVSQGSLLAVNGPPGTGKTSFLRAVIGTEYVRSALDGRNAPIILATAATNKAVTNIIESFAGIADREMQPKWSSRWLPHLPSYGWFYPASTRSDADLTGFMVLKHEGRGTDRRLTKQIAAEQFSRLEQTQRTWMADDYLELHRQTLGLPQQAASPKHAADMLRERLKASVETMHALQAAFRMCMEYPRKHTGFKFSEDGWQLQLDNQQAHLQDLAHSGQEFQDAVSLWNDVLNGLRESARLNRLRKGWFYWAKRVVLGDRVGMRADALETAALSEMTRIDPEISVHGADALSVAERQHARLIIALDSNRLKRDEAQRGLSFKQAQIGEWQEWRSRIGQLCMRLPDDEGSALRRAFDDWASASFPTENDLHRKFEESLDRLYRFRHFHMAARYWEARWLADIPTPGDAGDAGKEIDRAVMLAPVIVATVFTLPRIQQQFEFADLLIFDEAGQSAPEIGVASFAYAKRAIVVGDIHQLKPVWNVGKEADTRLLRDIEVDDVPQGFSASAGSIMKVAQEHTSFESAKSGCLGKGIGLIAHYRCRAEIIEYCRRLVYGEELDPVRHEKPPNGQKTFLYPPMSWVAIEARSGARKQGGSWANDDQVNEIIRWLREDGPRICTHYGVAKLSDVVALIAPFKAQAQALEKAAAELLGKDEADAMVINTVHALQGAEKPIVAFSVTQDEGNFFVDRDGPNLLNVAVSRAKDCFILFAGKNLLQPDSSSKCSYDFRSKADSSPKPLGVLLNYMTQVGKRLYPREVVVIEAPGKKDRISEALGLSAQVIATGGHFRKISVANGSLTTELLENGDLVVGQLKDATSDLRQIDAFYLATDDDADGEEIAWHVQDVLRGEGIKESNRILRMRFRSLSRQEIRQSRELALPGIDARRVRANVFRRLFDEGLHRQLSRIGVQASRPQLALLREISDRQEWAGQWRIRITGRIGGEQVVGYVLTENEISAPASYTTLDDARNQASNIPTPSVLSLTARNCRTVTLPRYPAATTAQTLIAAFRRHKLVPSETTAALEALYLGRSRGAVVPASPDGKVHEYSAAASKGLVGGVASYPRTGGRHVPPEIMQALIAAGFLAEDDVRSYRDQMKLKSALASTADRDARSTSVSNEQRIQAEDQHAHAMITPLLPLHAPSDIEISYQGDAGKVYGLVWTNTLAHLKNPQQVSESFLKYELDGVVVGMRTLSGDARCIVETSLELDELRSDRPALPASALSIPDDFPLELLSAEVEPQPSTDRDTDIASLIKWLETFKVVSPGRLGSILDELESKNWIRLNAQQYHLTGEGAAQLELLGEAGDFQITGMAMAHWRGLIDRCSASQEKLSKLLADSNDLFGTSLQMPVEQLELEINGTHAAEEAYRLRTKSALAASYAANFPPGMDPERLIPAQDPLREKKSMREAMLSAGREHEWLCMSGMERMMIRCGAELSTHSTEFEHQNCIDSLLFDVRARWLVGLGADGFPPTRGDALRAYKAWCAAMHSQ